MEKKYQTVNVNVKVLVLLTSWLTFSSTAELIPSFLQEPESTVIADGEAIFVCDVVPPNANILWLFNGNELELTRNSGYSLFGSNLEIDCTGKRCAGVLGVYQCKAETSVGSIISRPAVLTKAVFEFKPGRDVTINVTERGSVTLPCFSPNLSSPYLIKFQHSNGDVIDSNSDNVEVLPSGNIVLKNVELEKAGDYKCIIFNPNNRKNKTSDFTISLRVFQLSSTSSVIGTRMLNTDSTQSSEVQLKLHKGKNAILECPASGFPEPKVNWTKYGGYLKTARYDVISGNLHIKNVELRDEGTYLCSSNGSQRFVILEVVESPSINVGSDVIEAETGISQRLLCNVKGRPEPEIQWYHNGQLLTNSFTKILNGVTAKLISKVWLNDEGVYQCMASNPAGVSSASIYLRVKGQVVDPSGADGDQTSVMMNTNSPNETTGELTVEEDDDDDEDRPRSHKKDRKKKKNKNRKKNKKKKHRGKKRRKNKNGTVKLVPPSRPKVTQLSESSVSLNWTVPVNDGLEVTFFMIQYKEVSPVKSDWNTEDREISKNVRKYEVNNLKKGGTYKFRIAAVYTNDDNNKGQNSPRFTLQFKSQPNPVMPAEAPTIVEAKPIVFENVYGIGVRWQYRAPDSPKIEGFIIYCKPYDQEGEYEESILPGASVREYLLKYLKSDTEYSIKMQSFNDAGKSEYSNVVVKRTRGKPMGPLIPTPAPAKTTTTARSPPVEVDVGTSSNKSSGQMLYTILGIVLGIMLLLLIFFMSMCWWKQRQQRRMPVMNGILQSKFQDQSQRIYTDSMRKKYMNRGYPSNGYISNGHGPHSHPKLNINVNPVLPETTSLTRHTDTGKYYHNHVPNGNTSDNNFNNINANKTVMMDPDDPSKPMLSESDRTGEHIDNDDCIVYRSKCCGNHLYHQTVPGHCSNECDVPDADTRHRASPIPQMSVPPGFERLYKSEDRLSHKPFIDANLEPSDRQSYDSLSPSDHQSGHHSNKHRHRRKHRHSREQPTRDQATNTDLSSNEGTIEFTTFNKSGSHSDQINVQNPSREDSHCDDLSCLNQGL